MRDLTILCVTKAEPYAVPFLAHFVDVAKALDAHLAICVDTELEGFSKKLGSPIAHFYRVRSKGIIESVLDEAISKCPSGYIFRIDDDEKFSPALIEWLKSGAYRARDHWKFPRVHLWGDTEHFINAAPLYPDHQTRLSTKAKSGGRNTVHAGSPFGGGQLCTHPIEHHKFLVKTSEERQAIAARYDAISPGAGSYGMLAFNNPELFYVAGFPVDPYPNMAKVYNALDVAWKIGMHQHEGEIGPFAMWLESRKPHHVLEIGTLKGGTAALWHEIASGYVVSIDLPNGRFGGADHGYTDEAVAKRNAELEDRFPRIITLALDSHDVHSPQIAANHIADKEPSLFDFLFIDGDHTYEGVKRDYEVYSPLVRAGGIIAFHDVLDTAVHRAAGCDVARFWNELPEHKAVFSIDGPWGGIGVTFK
jgi:predicted O-methyltransferase YrrM